MRKKLTDILNGEGNDFQQRWNETQAAADFGPLPSGEYVAHVMSGELFTSKEKGTPGYKLSFRVAEGEHTGRRFWHDLWLSPAALPMAKRDLAKMGIIDSEQLEKPIPQGIRCKVRLALRKDEHGTEHNHVKTFAVVGIDPPEAEPFAPSDLTPPAPPPLMPAEATKAGPAQ